MEKTITKFNTATLLSYPRSGNTWFRYCIETITKLRTVGLNGGPLWEEGILPEHRTDNIETILFKEHVPKEGKGDKLILLTRNYKEVLIRTSLEENYENVIYNDRNKQISYINSLRFFDKYKGDKLLIYYENLLDNIEIELKKCLDFLNFKFDEDEIKEFISNIDYHRNKSLKIYGESETNGSDKIFHSKNIDKSTKKDWDNFYKSNYPKIFNKYLKKYEER